MATDDAGSALEIRTFPGTGSALDLLPRLSADNEPFVRGLEQGRLQLQRCAGCGRARWPIAPVCPYCRECSWRWAALAATGTVHSWVRHHRVFLDQFSALGDYAVLVVQMDEGVRLPGRLADPGAVPAFGMPVRAIVERWPDGGAAPAFVLDGSPGR